jgi:intermediate cleaving peptidase 55
MSHKVRSAAWIILNSFAIKSASPRPFRPSRWTRQFSHEVSAADLKFGQPIHETHPHLIQLGHSKSSFQSLPRALNKSSFSSRIPVTPEISAQEYHDRRQALAALLPPNSVAVLPSATLKYRSGPVFYPFHQDTNFFYLTGFLEPDAVAVIDNRPSHPLFSLLVREKDAKEELWEGARSGTIAARDVFNADESADVAHVARLLPQMLAGAVNVFADVPASFRPREPFARYFAGLPRLSDEGEGVVRALAELKNTRVQSVGSQVAKLRVLKSEAEVRAMRFAGKVAGRAHSKMMTRRRWATERDIALELKIEMLRSNCDDEAYVPVVAGGENALSIHYVQNNALLR